jgi:hypothetical protein
MPYLAEEEELLPEVITEEPPKIAFAPVKAKALDWLPKPKMELGTPPVVSDAAASRQAVSDIVAAQPDAKPKWWQQLAKAAAGFGAGYSNAQGNARPIDIERMSQGIDAVSRPKLTGQTLDWQRRLNVAQNKAEIDKANEEAWWKNRQNESTLDRNAADVEESRARGRYYDALANPEPKPPAAPKDPETQLIGNELWERGADGKWIKAATGPAKEPAEHNPNDWQLYLEANGNDPKKAIAQWKADRIAMRPPREASATAVANAERQRVRDQAGRIWAGTLKWMRDNGRDLDSAEQVAIDNATNPAYFPDEPDAGAIVAEIQNLARTQAGTANTRASRDAKDASGWLSDQTPAKQATSQPAKTTPKPGTQAVRVYDPKTGTLR